MKLLLTAFDPFEQMTKLFNKGGDGAGEIVRVLGLIDNG